MFNSKYERARSFGGRSRFQNNRAPQRSTIQTSRYINTTVKEEIEAPVTISHKFTDFGLHAQLLANIQSHHYDIPTPIQDQAIPALMLGKDVVGVANTGTGKTAAFLLPLIHKIAQDPTQGALILAPTRELALQIVEEFRSFAQGMKLGVCVCIGGANLDNQVRTLRNNPHFVIGTPGRINDLIERRALDPEMFANIVLDEVDRMLDIGFIHDIRFLISKLPKERQSAFFSATMNRQTTEIMRAFLKDPVQVSVTSRQTSNHIHQDVVRVMPGQNKISILHQLLLQKEFEKVIIFGRTKHGINKLETELSNLGIRVSSIHGNKTQGARQRSLQLFKRGSVQALLATDVAARGIDIVDVSHVINYDEPQTYDDYVHRIGRTGRAGKLGKALTFIS